MLFLLTVNGVHTYKYIGIVSYICKYEVAYPAAGIPIGTLFTPPPRSLLKVSRDGCQPVGAGV